MKNLYHVQDSTRPLYIVAETMENAVEKWKYVQAAEDPDLNTAGLEPDGVYFVCSGDDLVISTRPLVEYYKKR